MFLLLTLQILINLSFAETYRSPIRDICQDDRSAPFEEFISEAELRQRICDTGLDPTTGQLDKISFDTLKILDRLVRKKTNTDPWQDDPKIVKALGRMADKLDAKSKKYKKVGSGPLSDAIQELQDQFGKKKQREKAPEQYFKLLQNAIKQTSHGTRLLSCLETSSDPRIDGFQIRSAVGSEDGAKMFLEKVTDKHRKVIEVGLNSDPVWMIAVLAHEMQHTCDSTNALDNEKQDLRDAAQDSFIDEYRAHQLEVQVYHELAQAVPALACHHVLTVWGVPQRLSTMMANYDERLRDGSFANYLIPKYVNAGSYLTDEFFYDHSSDGTGKIKSELAPDFIEKIKKAGFTVSP